MSRLMTKPTKWPLRPVKTQISLGIRPIWSESSGAQWVAKDSSFLHADSKDSDQTGRTPRLNWVFAGRTCHFVGFVMRRLICFQTPFTLLYIWFFIKISYNLVVQVYHFTIVIMSPNFGLGDILFLPRSSVCLSVTNCFCSVTWKPFKVSSCNFIQI